MLPNISKTFHGRDIFSCVAAHLAKGVLPSKFGPETKNYIIPRFSELYIKKGEISGEIVYIDDFGNIITNISKKDLENLDIHEGNILRAKLKDRVLSLKLSSAYGDVSKKTPLATISSRHFLEISVNQGNASKVFAAKIGDPVHISQLKSSLPQ
jgi:hypothetical protein